MVRDQRQVGPSRRDHRHAGRRCRDRRLPRGSPPAGGSRWHRPVRIGRRARRASPTWCVRLGGAAAADRHSDRHPAARLAPPSDEAERHRHARSVACATRLGPPAVPGLHRIRRCCGDRRRWSGTGARTKADRDDPRGDPRHTATDTRGRQHCDRDTGRRNAQPGHAVHHTQQRLLSDRHCTVVPPDQSGELEGRHRVAWSTRR